MEKTHQEIELEPVIKIEEWIFLLLLAMIPIVNLVSFIYYSFSYIRHINNYVCCRILTIFINKLF